LLQIVAETNTAVS